MATLPSSPQTKSGNEPKNVSSNEIYTRSENNGLKSEQVQSKAVQKSSLERQVNANIEAPLPGTYYLKSNEARGKHMVQYVYANLTDPNEESLPFHIRERYKEIQMERLRGYQEALKHRGGTSPTRQHAATPQHFAGNKMPRPASARYERAQNISNDIGQKPSKYVTDVVKQVSPGKPNQKAAMKNIQQTRSSNAVLSPKRGSRSRSKTTSPRPRQPFSIAAESTSDTDPIENKRSMESMPHRSPPRVSGNRHNRRLQYLSTKFKLAAKNSKHTQTFVAAAASMGESSGSATTVISRHHSTTQTEIVDNKALKTTCSQSECKIEDKAEQKDTSRENHSADAEKPPIAPQIVAKSEATLSTLVEKGHESLEWKRAKVRLRSTPRSPSPPSQDNQHRVASVDRVLPSKEKPSCLTGGRAASGHSGLTSRLESSTTPAPERRFTTSATQIEVHQTTSTGVQVKLKKKRSPSQRQARKQRRSPSERSVASKMSSQSGSKPKEDNEKSREKKKKKKKNKAKSRDPSIRSLRSLRSFQSDASTGILKHVKIANSFESPARPPSGKSISLAALGEATKKKKKMKIKVKRKKSSSKIARFLRTLSKDKEAIKVISQMAATKKNKSRK